MNHTVTVSDVKAIYQAELAKTLPESGIRKTVAEARQGTRVTVHARLHEQLPTPYPLPAPPRYFQPHEGAARNADIAARKAAMHASVPEAVVLEWARLPPGVGPGTRDQTRDPHHLVQKRHGQQLWDEADRLVVEALGGAA